MIHSFSFFLVSILLLQSFSHGSADELFITSICGRTPMPNDCKSVLMSDSRSLKANNIQGLIQIAFDIAISRANAAYTEANDLMKQYPGKNQHEALSQCSQLYMDMSTELCTGRKKAQQSKFDDASGLAFDAETKPDACDTGFLSGGMYDLLNPTNHDLTKKCAVCAGLTALLK